MNRQSLQPNAMQRLGNSNPYLHRQGSFLSHYKVQNLLKRFNRSVSYFINKEKTFLFKNETDRLVYPAGESSYRLKIFTGLSTTPDDVAELITPRSGEMLCVLFRANRILAYARAAVCKSFSKSGKIMVNPRAGEVHLTELKFLVDEQFEDMLAVFLSAITRKLHFMGFSSVYIACRDRHNYGIRNIVKAGFELKMIMSTFQLFGSEIAKTIQSVHFHARQVTPAQEQKRLPAAKTSRRQDALITSVV
ncbi:MAG: hypothetical protein DWQ10_02700 [Calditrichaeota bacterium]|nr:MAG: hypothetical protein DWQ10_02700 [Calditrichota bacterium]